MENKTHNREWVKNAAIIFLVVLLVLTFFSNTIMNRTLPEVSSAQVSSGAITAKVRGTGTVTAIGNTDVKAEATRFISSVMVKDGQIINAGDVLFIMGEGDSDELDAAKEELDNLEWELKSAQANYPSYYNSAAATNIDSLYNQWIDAQQKLAEVENQLVEESTYILRKNEYQRLQDELTALEKKCQNEESLIQAQYQSALANGEDTTYLFNLLETTITNNQISISQKKSAVENAKTIFETSLLSTSPEITTAQRAVESAEYAYKSAIDASNSSSDAASKSYTQANINVQKIQSQIEKAKAKVEELSGGAENQVLARVGGTVHNISFTSGNKVNKSDILCTIENPDQGYQVSFSVTNDQAKRLKIGDTATISNYYYGNEILATVSSIKIDVKDPQTKKVIVCDLSGNVTSGTELTVSIGQKSATYDFVVPKNAVRTDSNGTFVLVIDSKNSALGNRYFARRVDVEELATDDISTAVNGSLSNGDFVITNSSVKVSNKDQVKLANG